MNEPCKNHGVFCNSMNPRPGLEELDFLLRKLEHSDVIKVRNLIDDYVSKKLKKLSRTQIIEIPAQCLRRGDIIFDLKYKYIQRVQYVSHYDSTHSNKENNTICICYGDNYDCDNVGIHAQVYILVDMAEYVDRNVQNHHFEQEYQKEN